MKKILGIIFIIVGSAMAILSLAVKIKGQIAITVPSADGPTSVFFAGKVGNSLVLTIVTGIVLVAAGIFMVIKKR